MRLLLFPLAILLGIFSFSTLESPSPETATIKGAWELVDFYYYEDNEVMDTVIPTKGYRQVKVFTKDRVMWTRSAPIDSVEWFGYGRYIVADDKLI